jgi:hypothetical protein
VRSLEVHLFETERDVDLAIKSGTALPEQIASTKCIDCSDAAGYDHENFHPFILVIDENDQDWILCCDCAGPILSYVDAFFPPVVRSHFAHDLDDDDLDLF